MYVFIIYNNCYRYSLDFKIFIYFINIWMWKSIYVWYTYNVFLLMAMYKNRAPICRTNPGHKILSFFATVFIYWALNIYSSLYICICYLPLIYKGHLCTFFLLHTYVHMFVHKCYANGIFRFILNIVFISKATLKINIHILKLFFYKISQIFPKCKFLKISNNFI